MEKKQLGAAVLAIDLSSGKILLGRRGLDGESANTWAPFGGTYDEEDGHPKVTAKREFWEESRVGVPYKISKEPFYINKDNILTFYTYLGLFDNPFQVMINHEHLGYAWFELDNLPDNLHPGVEEMLNNKMGELKQIVEKFKNGNF